MKKIVLVLFMSLTLIMTGCSKVEKPEELESKVSEAGEVEEEIDNEYDVVIVGAGGAGLSAALSAHEAGADVVVLEKMPIPGGNTILASAGMNASETKFQTAEGIEDSNELFIEETMAGGYEKNDKALVEFLANNSGAAIDWLDSYGIELSNLTITGGMSVKRTHRPADGSAVGGYLVSGLVKAIEEKGIEIKYYTDVKELIVEDDKVIGVKAEVDSNEVNYFGKSVIVTTGGFSSNAEMVKEYSPELDGYISTNHSGATGDGIVMIEKVGGQIISPEFIQIHPTVEQSSSDLITEGLRGGGAILVNTAGERFVNELETRDVVSKAELEQEGSSVWILFDETVHENFKAVDKYIANGYVKQANTIEELASEIEVDSNALVNTINTYNENIKSSTPDEFGRETGLEIVEKAPYYAIKVAPGVHHTMGGVKINSNTEVLGAEDKIISGLYAAGELTGGVHGGNRIGGNAVTDIIVFGRQAGNVAGQYALANGGHGIKDRDVKKDDSLKIPTETGKYVDGEYEAIGKGFAGDIPMTIKVENGNIVDIIFGENGETELLFESARSEIVKYIVEEQDLDGVDVVSGATKSSEGIISAVREVMKDKTK